MLLRRRIDPCTLAISTGTIARVQAAELSPCRIVCCDRFHLRFSCPRCDRASVSTRILEHARVNSVRPRTLQRSFTASASTTNRRPTAAASKPTTEAAPASLHLQPSLLFCILNLFVVPRSLIWCCRHSSSSIRPLQLSAAWEHFRARSHLLDLDSQCWIFECKFEMRL